MPYPPMKLEDEFKFGKYKGSTVQQVISENKSYMDYMLGKGIIRITDEAAQALEQAD